jgi:hypothetical protein
MYIHIWSLLNKNFLYRWRVPLFSKFKITTCGPILKRACRVSVAPAEVFFPFVCRHKGLGGLGLGLGLVEGVSGKGLN